MNKHKLSDFLQEVSQWRWDQFVTAELDEKYTTSQSIVFSLIRACAMENLPAIRTALGRLDGKLETPIRLVMPKVYTIYPNAKEALAPIVVEAPETKATTEVVVMTEEEMLPIPELPTKGFREAMEKMSEMPRTLPKSLIESQERVEKFVRHEGRAPERIPKVQSVVVAHVLKMAQERNMDAVNEVFDQLDGKLVETIRVVGEDMYIMSFAEIAPAGAFKNSEGVYMLEATKSQEMWRKKLSANTSAIIQT